LFYFQSALTIGVGLNSQELDMLPLRRKVLRNYFFLLLVTFFSLNRYSIDPYHGVLLAELALSLWVYIWCGLFDNVHCRDVLQRAVFEHVESKHVAGGGHSCPICSKHCRSLNALRSHVVRQAVLSATYWFFNLDNFGIKRQSNVNIGCLGSYIFH
jgi:hypothetical protein